MEKFNHLLTQLVLFLSLISLITTQINWIDYDPNTYTVTYEHDRKSDSAIVGVDFKDYLVPYYMKVTATPEKDSTTPLICFSPTSNSCGDNRIILTRNGDQNPAILFLKREDFSQGQNELYIYAKCQESNCGFSLKFEGAQSAEIDANSIFSYVVTSNNREMIYEIKGEAEEGDYLTIGVEGSSSVQLLIENNEKSPLFLDYGRIITIPIIKKEEGSNTLAKLTVKGANLGEYLTLNIHIVNRNAEAPDNLLYPNGPVVMGMLDGTKGYFKEECFPISAFVSEKYSNVNKYYLTGKIHSKYALFWLADEGGMYMEETEQEIADGQLSFLIENNGKKRSVCFEFSYEDTVSMEYVAYSISILEPTNLQPLYNFYPPQTVGEVYRRMIPRGSIAVYHPAKLDSSDKKITYNMFSRKGVAEMYINECRNFPSCIYKANELTNFNRPKKINRMTIWEKSVSNTIEALSQSKDVMIVYCRDDDNENNGYCEVDTSFYSVRNTINLVENEKFSKYVVKGDKGNFKIDLKGGVKIQRLSVDIMIYSGDVNFKAIDFEDNLNNGKLNERIEYTYHKYYLSNKIYYYFNLAQLIYDSVEISYTAELNSFFTIQYEYSSKNLNQLEEKVYSGESYLVQIDPTKQEKYKTIFLSNYRTKKEMPFLANFFSLNCDFEVTRGEKEIDFFDGYAQEILTKDTQGYNSEQYEYKVTIKEADPSNYNHKMCMLYVAGYESRDKESVTEIVVAENVNQQVIFNQDFDSIRFLYPLANREKDLAIHVNIIDQAFYYIRIYFNSENTPYSISNYKITRSQIYYIPSSDIRNYCEADSLCSVTVEASYDRALDVLDRTNDPMIEITIREIKNVPSYLQKSQAKLDFTCGDNYYYLYTEIGKNEIGEISVNFLRDFGNVWAKIVRKDQSYADEEVNWRGKYRMPSEDWEDSYLHNLYTKKIQFGVEQTQECIEGCYLLLSIRISQIGEYVENYKFYPFSIITRITPNNYAYTDIPKVRIQVNEYIIGNVDIAENERIFQFYEVWLPHDSYRVDFDFQSKVAGLYINLGGVRPTTKNADFKLLPPGRDSILTLDKYAILQKAESKKIKVPNPNSLQDINLVIGVWTDKADSYETEIFSLGVREPNDDITFDIIEVNTDQKIMCNPRYLNDNLFRCLFMLIYDDEDVQLEMPILVHAASVNQSAVAYTHASFIERKYYDEFDVNTLRSSIPTLETAEFSTQRDDVNYIYTQLDKRQARISHNYLFINVITDKQDDIFLLTSMPMYNVITQKEIEFYPNPSTEQLLFLSVEKLSLKFFTSSSLIVNIVTLGGEADIIWKKDPQNVHYLRGRGDRLALTSGTKLDEIIITKRSKTDNSLNAVDPGFIFYVSYYERDAESNFDEIEYGKSIEMSYRDTDLPVYLYSKIDSVSNDIIAAITFRDSELDTKGEIFKSPFLVKASIAKESVIYKAKRNPELSPSLSSSFLGIYDPALKTAIVFLSNTVIRNYDIKIEDNPTLYLSLEKNSKAEVKKYEKFSIETQFTKLNGALIPVEKTYNYGRYSGYYANYYRLKIDKNKGYMLIELSFNSNYLNFAVNQAITRVNMTNLILKAEKARGKILLLLNTKIVSSEFICLNIYREKLMLIHFY